MAPDTESSIVCKASFEAPACEFYERSTLFHGVDMVHIISGPSKDEMSNEERVMPPTVLFYYSKVCERKLVLFRKIGDTDAVDTNGQNHNNAILELDEWDAETFDMALQWMHTGNIVINIAKPQAFEVIRLIVQFFKIAKALELEGSYLCSDTNAMKTKEFKKLFKEIEGLELDVLRLVGESLSSLSMGKLDSDGYSRSTMWCPLTELRSDAGTMYKVRHFVSEARLGNI